MALDGAWGDAAAQLRHFEEELGADCGNCDGCLDPQPRFDAIEVARKALSAVYRTGQRFGAAHVVDVLPQPVARRAAPARQPGLPGITSRGGAVGRSRANQPRSADLIDAESVDAALLDALKGWRRDQARDQGVPPYVVFHDRTLAELAARVVERTRTKMICFRLSRAARGTG